MSLYGQPMSAGQMQHMQPQPSDQVKFTYKIIYCSGEDPKFPVTELLDPTVNSKGWQSQKFCQYPQEIILQFPGVVHLHQLQFLSHQSKIASKIELFTFNPTGMPAANAKLPLNEIQFTKLGFLTLNSNERSGFQARELKSVTVNTQCALLKLLFHQCHQNQFNVQNQIGLIALNCIGPSVPQTIQRMHQTGPIQTPSPLSPSGQSQAQQSAEMNFYDKETQMKLKQLEMDKALAVQNENYDLAKYIRNQIERLKSVGVQLQSLEGQKQVAISQENFDLAKNIKEQMDNLKYQALNGNVNQPVQSEPAPVAPPKSQANIQVFQKSANHFGVGDDVQVTPLNDGQLMGSSQVFNAQNPASLDAVSQGMTEKQKNAYNSQFFGQGEESDQFAAASTSPPSQNPLEKDWGRLNEPQGNPNYPPHLQPPPRESPALVNKPKVIEDVDSQVIPTMKGGAKADQPPEYAPGEEYKEEEYKDGEPIAPDKQAAAQPLIQIFGEQNIRKIFSRTWGLREDGITTIEEEILHKRMYDEADAFVGGIGVVKNTIGDKISGVCQRSIQLLTNLCTQSNPSMDFGQKKEVEKNTDTIVSTLVEKLGDNLAKVRLNAENAMVAMCNHDAFGAAPPINHLLRTANPSGANASKAKKTMNSNKLIIGKYQTLARILGEVPNIPNDLLQKCLPFSNKGLQHALQDVRQPAQRCMVELYKYFGGQVRDHFGGLRQAQIDQIEQQIAEVEGGGGPSRPAPQQQQTIQTNINPKGAAGGQRAKANNPGGGARQPPQQQHSQQYQQQQQQQYDYDNQQNYQQQQDQYQQQEQAYGGQPQYDQADEYDDNEKVCNFCGRYDENFDTESIDIHYWKECPMLTTCWECEQVIETHALTEHLVDECQSREKYMFCDKCRTVLLKEDFYGHQCMRPQPPGAAKCPLCTISVFPDSPEGWKKHLMVDMCPANSRNAFNQ